MLMNAFVFIVALVPASYHPAPDGELMPEGFVVNVK
jgi:hypothetical protein